MSHAQNITDFFRRAATGVDKILHGAKPPDLPVEQPINHAALRALPDALHWRK